MNNFEITTYKVTHRAKVMLYSRHPQRRPTHIHVLGASYENTYTCNM